MATPSTSFRLAPFALAGAVFFGISFSGTALAADAGTSNAELDQRIKILERQLEIQKEEADTKAKDAYTSTFNEKGLSIKNAKGDFEFKFRGLVQADARYFFDDFNPTDAAVTPANHDTFYFNDTVLLRRVEPTFELSLGKLVFFRLQPQFSGDTASTADVYGELRFLPQFAIRAGKFKGPVGLENLRSTANITFIERGLPTELAPNRDLGIQLQGDLFDARLSYAFGYFNGTPDGRDANGTNDPDNKKELGARLFTEPFKNDPGLFQGLGFGVGGTRGPKNSNQSSVANDFLPRYRTPGQNTFFSYQGAVAAVTGTTPKPAEPGTVADGTFSRISPQAYWFFNSFGVLGEYIVSKQHVVRGPNDQSLEHDAWQVTANWFITGEDAAYRGLSKVVSPYTVGGPGWGAFEVAARYGELDIDNDAFDDVIVTVSEGVTYNARFANPATQASKAKAGTLAFNWYPTVNTKVGLNYTQTKFDGGAAADEDRAKEKALFARFQINY